MLEKKKISVKEAKLGPQGLKKTAQVNPIKSMRVHARDLRISEFQIEQNVKNIKSTIALEQIETSKFLEVKVTQIKLRDITQMSVICCYFLGNMIFEGGVCSPEYTF
uniref:Uncharacterized protein n=1 Tax=Lepeophtheirus salmonis TaxID=72036 RepID=A0A0K2TAT6_LEPSM